MSDPQAGAESIDEEELPDDVAPDKFIEPEDWDAGAGAAEGETDSGDYEDDIGQERESPLNAEDAAMHIEPGISGDD